MVAALNENQLPTLPDQLDSQPITDAFEASIPSDKEIDISFFSHKSRKSTRLIGNSSSESMRAKREWLSFDLHEPVYVTSIKVAASGYEDYHEMEISLIDALTGGEIKEARRFSGSGFTFEPKRFVRGFGLRPDQPWSLLKSQHISRIDVRGLEQSSFFEVIQIYENASREKNKIEEDLSKYFLASKRSSEQININLAKISEQEENINDLNDQIDGLSRRISSLSEERDGIDKRIEIGATVEKERNERVQAIQNNIHSLNNERRALSEHISKSELTLKELKNEINLFPTEIAGYVGQGKKNITLYAWLSVIPVLIIFFVTYRLFYNAERLLNFDISGNAFDVIKYLLSRSPYVAVSAAVLGICYSLVLGLFSEIININRRRQELFKISIIATDVSYASQDGMNLNDETVYNLRTQTKMELLKEHLKLNIGDEFTYSPRKAFSEKLNSVIVREDNASSEIEEITQK
jgi:hypothetical protein